jgi:hypothetical protein
MIGADGAKGVQIQMRHSDMNGTENESAGVVRKQLGLTFSGETRDHFHIVTGDIRLTGAGLDRTVSPFKKKIIPMSLMPFFKYWHRFGGFDSRAYVYFLPLEIQILITHSLSLLPRDEVGDDGWQFFFLGPDLDMGKIAQSEELVFETIASMLNTEITFNKLIWATDYRYVRVFSLCIDSEPSSSDPIYVWCTSLARVVSSLRVVCSPVLDISLC